ncbi:ferritin-like domain-containing protein [Crucibulum laeve]|uniref:Ferritin-like domain-containing protein n=1 Tax=Crucibulum laeve TaxID=68775 RepID=A0A5C3MC90_9AGAR|nr:ferritin-like domain-containing protein [Crucibulum laeve]
MRFTSSLLAIAAAPLLVSAAPARIYGKRAAADILVFKFADVLEQLESEFYTQALAKFQESDFVAAGFSSSQIPGELFKGIQADEATHSSVLQAALKAFGETPITSCKFKFDSVLTDVATMAATARVVENVGVSAYLGGATLLTDPVLLTAAGSILTIEARHQTVLNILSSTGTAIPSAFDIALTPSEVLAIAGGFFDGACDVGIPANPALALTNTGSVGPGTLLTFSSTALNSSTDGLFCQMLLGGATSSIALPLSQCIVPQINGPVAIFITSDGQPLLNNVRDRATTQLVAGPTLAFIDTQPQVLGQLARGSAGAGSNQATTTSTQTLSPAEASAAIASASAATATAADASVTSAADASAATPATDASAATSAADASATSAAADASASATPAASNNVAGGPNMFTGKSPDGKVTVNGWVGV